MIFLEGNLIDLRKKIAEKPSKNRLKQYKEYLNQYLNIIRCISKISAIESDDDKSSLGEWLDEFKRNGLDRNEVHSR